MNVNFLRKFFMLVLLVVGCAGGAWADDDSSTAVAEVLDADGNKYDEYTALETAVNAASDKSAENSGANWTVKCLADYDCNNSLTVNENKNETAISVTLDLNGHKINLLNTINGVSIKAKLKIIDGATGGELNCKTTLYTGVSSSSSKVLTSEIEFASGTFNIAELDVPGILTISGGKLSVDKITTIGASPSTIGRNITGGFIKESGNVLRQCVDEKEHMVEENTYLGDGYYAVIPSSAVALNYNADGALVGWYDTFYDASSLSNVQDGMTIRLCANCEVNHATYIGGNGVYSKGVFLDLNGYELKCVDKGFLGVSSNGFVMILDESASQSGKITYSKSAMISVEKGATLNIFGGNFISGYGMMFYSNGTINIYGGKFSYKDMFTNGLDDSEMNILGGFFNKNTVSDNYAKKEEVYWTKYIADSFMEIDNSGVEGYPYAVVPVGANLTYGDGTTAKAPVYNGLTLDLKDDESDHNAWVSKIDVPNDTETTDVTVKKNFANTNWHAFYVPFDINVSEDLLQNFEIAKIWDTELNLNDNSTTIEFIKLKDGESISAFTPCLIKATATGKQDITFPNVTVYKNQTKSIDCSNVDETFTFTGVMENTNINGCYALKSETNSLVLANSANAQVTPLKFYMTVESKTPATSIKSKKFAVRVIGDETTGISDINAGGTDAKAANATVYNVQGAAVGTSLNGLPAGLYIQNGRKVVVK